MIKIGIICFLLHLYEVVISKYIVLLKFCCFRVSVSRTVKPIAESASGIKPRPHEFFSQKVNSAKSFYIYFSLTVVFFSSVLCIPVFRYVGKGCNTKVCNYLIYIYIYFSIFLVIVEISNFSIILTYHCIVFVSFQTKKNK